MAKRNPILPFVAKRGAFVLDGGLATELEAQGADLSDDLWSARLLRDDPDMIQNVHLAYFKAGADCALTASYQATIPGFMAQGMSEFEALRLMWLSVNLAVRARDAFWADTTNHVGRERPLVVASVGPYGAYLADGSEYRGDYDLDEDDLTDWHRRRWRILAGTQADLLACETIPSLTEARAQMRLLQETPERMAWFSFSCQDGNRISDGTPIAECAAYLDQFEQVAAVGINCTPPRFLPDLIQAVFAVTQKPIIVYPNSGETYDAARKHWQGHAVPAEFGTLSRAWRKLGASGVGGCCRTRPAHIQQICCSLSKAVCPPKL
ncbi:MAG: homocysteine S-methyltransferase [Chloroflexi bacterium]|nr:MAG: homocysteine S-methyltransferase [Chloroflexota bacterium]PIE81738.1 MAG: homocysteine S-methyltransferase [Chloroflexota bacterium]